MMGRSVRERTNYTTYLTKTTKVTNRVGGRVNNGAKFDELEFLDEDNNDGGGGGPRACSSLAQGMHATLPWIHSSDRVPSHNDRFIQCLSRQLLVQYIHSIRIIEQHQLGRIVFSVLPNSRSRASFINFPFNHDPSPNFGLNYIPSILSQEFLLTPKYILDTFYDRTFRAFRCPTNEGLRHPRTK